MEVIFEFIKQHWAALSAGLFGLIWVIVRLTPSEKDDQILRFLQNLFNFLIPDRKKEKRTYFGNRNM